MKNQVSLSDVIYQQDYLSNEQIAELIGIIGYRCRFDTKDKLDRRLQHPALLRNYGIFTRVIVSPMVEYVAGQDYTAEIKTVRELILKG